LLISIITPCLNRAGFVAEAVESVRRQDYPYVEHIVMDGGSTDGTIEVLGNYPHLLVFSQPDAGIYDALNKGIRLARGEALGFLNTDDLYEPGIFGSVAKTFMDNPEIDALVGGASIFYEKSNGERVTAAIFPRIAQNELLVGATQGAPIFNAWFFRKRLFDELGIFETPYRYVADRDFLIRMAFHARSYASLDRTFYHYRMHPGSYTLSGQDSGEAEFMFECRALAERYIRLDGISPKALKCLKDWHSQITADQIITAWRRRAFRRISGYILTGLRYNYFGWPKIFMGKSIERVSVFLAGVWSRALG
jgi:glycosyltransferase involved in cell wall biosynthesis